jgi:hypothetical protein
LIDVAPDWSKHWQGMPEFKQQNLMPWQSVTIHFRNLEDRRAFSSLMGQPISELTKYLWYPKNEIVTYLNKEVRRANVQPKYPVYIISKGRWESRLTALALDSMGVSYKIVIEPQEYDLYAAVIDPERILTLPFSNLGQGSIPARNWVWEHAISTGAERHWILDDNIRSFMTLKNNLKKQVIDGQTFIDCENMTDRFSNVALSGMNYQYLAKRKQKIPPFVLNTRIYSCILIRNDLSYRWRGRYNEDTDLSIRALKDGWCTILFNAFLADKQTTMTMKGGNTDELYQGDGRLKMAQSLYEQHPDVVTITEKWGRPQHHVNYKIFRNNKLIKKAGAELIFKRDGTWQHNS